MVGTVDSGLVGLHIKDVFSAEPLLPLRTGRQQDF